MTTPKDVEPNKTGFLGWFSTRLGQTVLSVLILAGTVLVLWQGFAFLKRAEAPQIVQIIVAILWWCWWSSSPVLGCQLVRRKIAAKMGS